MILLNVLADSISMLMGEYRWKELYDEELILQGDFTTASIPRKLKASIKFGYEETILEELGSQRHFESWLAEVFTHTQAYFRHSASLGTEVDFEVGRIIKTYSYPSLIL